MLLSCIVVFLLCSISSAATTACLKTANETTINALFSKGGAKTVVQLCESTTYTIYGTIYFSAAGQELSTRGYPTGSTRAVITLASGNDVSTLVAGGGLNGVMLKNVIVDGARATNGYISGGGANIEFGGYSNGQIITYVASRNPRSWSCMHVIESGNNAKPCTNATVTHNDIGPCGVSGNSQWADGISFACTNSLVSTNTVTGSTDGGIVIFGAPGTSVTGNTITSSSTYQGFGAINMVDGTYNGNYSGVSVTSNKIVGSKLFSVGIAIGSSVWGVQSSNSFTGPATIKGNTFSGNITFPIAINGWSNGLTVSGNTVTAVATPSTFSDHVGCSWPTQQLWMRNAALSYYSPGITGALSLQSGFVNSTAGSPTYFICTEPILPKSAVWTAGALSISAAGTVASLHDGITLQFQGSDGNLVVYNTSLASASSGWSVNWASGGAPGGNCNPTGNDNLCELTFSATGNLVASFNGTTYWQTSTSAAGGTFVVANAKPFLSVLTAAGTAVWTSS